MTFRPHHSRAHLVWVLNALLVACQLAHEMVLLRPIEADDIEAWLRTCRNPRYSST